MNTNFQDIVDATSDGTIDFNIAALTCAGAVVLNGAVTLGNATSDDITITGYIASSLLPKTTGTPTVGNTTVWWGGAYIGNGTYYTGILPAASPAASYTIRLPSNVPDANNYALVATTGGVGTWHRLSDEAYVATAPAVGGSTPYQLIYTDNKEQVLSPQSAVTYLLPSTSVVTGMGWKIMTNQSDNLITVQSSGGGTVCKIDSIYSTAEIIALRSSPTAASHWFLKFNHEPPEYTGTAAYRNGVYATIEGTDYTYQDGRFIPYQQYDGSWRLKFSLMGSFTAAAALKYLTLSGVTGAAWNQPVAAYGAAGSTSRGMQAALLSSANTFAAYQYANTMSAQLCLSGDVRILTKPTWAY